MTNEVPAGLSPDAELRYRMVAHVLNTRHVYPDAVEAVVEDLIRYIRQGARHSPVTRNPLTAAVPMPHFSLAEATIRAQQNADAARMVGAVLGGGQTQQLRQEDQSRG